MGPAVFIIAILGCGETETSCQQVATASAQYSSFAECTRATDDALARSGDVDFPIVVAQCKAAGTPASLELRGDQVKLPEAETTRREALMLTRYEPRLPKRR
jgi:hypothetical protein